jgi:FtsH-binding integral membrane protein
MGLPRSRDGTYYLTRLTAEELTMNYATENPYRSWGMVAAEAETSERASFIRLTYLHLAAAVAAFVAIEAALLQTSLGARILETLDGNRFGWLLVLGAFVGVSWVANAWANSSTSKGMQYLGLSLYVVAEAVIFLPLLYFAGVAGPPNVIANAAILTAVTFGGLTAIVFVTGADFSWLRTGLMVGMFAALGVIVCSAIFGFNLGIVFIAAVLLLSAGYILYETSNVLHHYRIGQHVAAALALFAAVALMFWYMVQLLMSLSGRD